MHNRVNKGSKIGRRQNTSVEKPKNFKVALQKMFNYLKPYQLFIYIALVLAALSSVFSIIGPNKLSDLTNEISDGLMVNKNNMELLSNDIKKDFSKDNISEVSKIVLDFKLDENDIGRIYSSSDITTQEKLDFNTFLSNISSYSKDEIVSKILDMPKSVQETLLNDITYNDIKISSKDRISYLKLTNEIKNENSTQKQQLIYKIPDSIKKVLLTNTTIKNIKISKNDKLMFLNKISSVNKKSDTNIYSALDNMPKSIKSLIKPKINMIAVRNIGMFLLIIYIISALFNYLQGFIMASVSNYFSKDMRSKISNKINNLPLKYFDNHSNGDILSRITNDVDTVGVSMYQSFGSLVGAITLFIGSIIMMFATNWVMAITAIISSLFGFVFVSFILSKSQKYFDQRQIQLGNINGHIEEIYSSHNVVKAYNGSKSSSHKFDKLNKNIFECDHMSQFLSGLMPSMMGFIGNFGYVCVCIVGAALVINNNITFGTIVAFIIYVRLFSSPLSQIAEGMMSLQSATAASERVFEFLEENEMNSEKHIAKKLNKNNVKGNIEFNHVKFGYEDGKTIIKDFTCKVKPGQKIAIVGPTGAGKTTMVNLLMKFYEIKSGDILIDGVSTKELTRKNIHELFVMVLQDTWLFNGTIKENIIYNKNRVTNKMVEDACKTVGLDHFIKTLPDGYDTILNDTESISAGQKQLLTIARGMIQNAPFLILDEATSSVDTRTEELVQKAMDKLTEGRTSFIIAHRLSTIKNADLILVMNEGNIIEQGTHKQLMNKNGFYAELYNSQFKN